MTLERIEKVFDRIIIIGVGGIGANLALQISEFTRNISLYDHDTLEYHNLNRVKLGLINVGAKKTKVARELIEHASNLKSSSKLCNINNYDRSPKLNDVYYFDSDTLVIDCTDKYFNAQEIYEHDLKFVDYKLNYDGGMWMTVTKNPYAKNRDTSFKLPIHELSQGSGYEIIPSLFAIPDLLVGQFIHNIVLKEGECRSRNTTEQYVVSAFDYVKELFA